MFVCGFSFVTWGSYEHTAYSVSDRARGCAAVRGDRRLYAAADDRSRGL